MLKNKSIFLSIDELVAKRVYRLDPHSRRHLQVYKLKETISLSTMKQAMHTASLKMADVYQEGSCKPHFEIEFDH